MKRVVVGAVALAFALSVGASSAAGAAEAPSTFACQGASYVWKLAHTSVDEDELSRRYGGLSQFKTEWPAKYKWPNNLTLTKLKKLTTKLVAYCDVTIPAFEVEAYAAAFPLSGTATITIPRPVASAPATVIYTLEGTGSASVTMSNASGGTEQFDVALPWSQDLGPKSGFVYVSGQLNGSGNITCRITKGARVIQEASSSGQYVIASCSGSA